MRAHLGSRKPFRTPTSEKAAHLPRDRLLLPNRLPMAL